MIQLSMQTVVAGLIRRDGAILIAQRSAQGPHPLKWEFPGGKVEAGETAEEALHRELHEELGIEAVPGAEFGRYEYSYPGKSAILLRFFEVESYSGTLENQRAFEAVRWETPNRLSRYDFLAGDLALIELLCKIEIDQV